MYKRDSIVEKKLLLEVNFLEIYIAPLSATAAVGRGGGIGREGEKNAVSPFVNGSRKKIFLLLSVSDNKFGGSCMRNFFNNKKGKIN